MVYREIKMDGFAFLQKCVTKIYEIKNDTASGYLTIPNGYIGMSVIASGNAWLYKNNCWEEIPGCMVYGLTKTIQPVKLGQGFREFTITFKPHFLRLLLKENMSHFADGDVAELDLLLDKYDVEKLGEKLANATSDAVILKTIDDFLQKRLTIEKIDSRVAVAFDIIKREKLHSVREVCGRLNISATTLRKMFNDQVGLSPKDIIRITRINNALQHKMHDEESLTGLGYELGYFDQAHFIHEFKSVLGITPTKYFKNKALTFDFYNFDRWRQDSFATLKQKE